VFCSLVAEERETKRALGRAELQSGQIIRDLILEERIGAGGVGEVWTARHRHLDKVVAIKAIYSHLDQDPQFYDRFVHEAVAMARLDHPHIVAVHDFFFEDGNAYLVMSYVQGNSLQDIINERAPLPIEEARDIAAQVLDALDYAHQQGVIHRDVKPSNILIRSDRRAYLVDFGIALVLGQKRITKFGTNIGTPEYMSPEQIKASPMDARTDVYSFGCVLYEMLTGRPPFGSQDEEGVTDFEVMNGHVNQLASPLRPLNQAVDPATEAAVLKALEKEPERRFQTCGEMADAVCPRQATARRRVRPPPTRRADALLKALLALTFTLSAAMVYPTYSWLTRLPGSGGQAVRDPGSAARIAELTSQLESLRAEGRSLDKRIQGLRTENELLKAKIDKPMAENKPPSERRVSRLLEERGLLHKEIETLRKEKEDLWKSFMELSVTLETRENELKRCRTDRR
jgi:serine/threonine protein kinase